MTLRILGGRLFDPGNGIDRVADVLIEDGTVSKIGKVGGKGINAKGLWVVPGLIDMHVHLREPGHEAKETIDSGVRAAARGGFTAVAAMANTGTPVDSEAGVVYVCERARQAGGVRVYPVGAVSRRLEGKELAELGRMAGAGAVAFSDDGHPVLDSALMRRALEYTRMLNRAVISHCEDTHLTRGAIMNEGRMATELGLRGSPNAAEAVMAARDIALADLTGGRLHLAHVSTRETVDLLRDAKRRGIHVTAEAAPHHLTLTDECLRGYESKYRMNPPLRTKEDIAAVVEALADGTIDAIASDHAPHTVEEKERELAEAPNGVVGLETTVGVVLSRLVAEKKITLKRAIEAMTSAPAKILGVDCGGLKAGSVADLTIIDPKAKWTVDSSKFASRGRCTPFEGWKLVGKAVQTVVGGKIVG